MLLFLQYQSLRSPQNGSQNDCGTLSSNGVSGSPPQIQGTLWKREWEVEDLEGSGGAHKALLLREDF